MPEIRSRFPFKLTDQARRTLISNKETKSNPEGTGDLCRGDWFICP